MRGDQVIEAFAAFFRGKGEYKSQVVFLDVDTGRTFTINRIEKRVGRTVAVLEEVST